MRRAGLVPQVDQTGRQEQLAGPSAAGDPPRRALERGCETFGAEIDPTPERG